MGTPSRLNVPLHAEDERKTRIFNGAWHSEGQLLSSNLRNAISHKPLLARRLTGIAIPGPRRHKDNYHRTTDFRPLEQPPLLP